MPPSWIVLTSFYLLDPTLNIVVLAVIGATGATIGRYILQRISGLFRRFVSDEQRTNLDIVSGYLGRKRFGYAVASFLFGATPLPSNFLFIAYGLMRARSIGIYAGFWLGRVISYVVMIHFGNAVLSPFLEMFEDRLTGILVVDAARGRGARTVCIHKLDGPGNAAKTEVCQAPRVEVLMGDVISLRGYVRDVMGGDPAHDFGHVMRVCRNAHTICSSRSEPI